MQILINDRNKVIVVPEHVYNDDHIVFNNKTIIITEISDEDERNFGGSFVKLCKKGDSFKTVYVSCTLLEEELKQFIEDYYGVDKTILMRYY